MMSLGKSALHKRIKVYLWHEFPCWQLTGLLLNDTIHNWELFFLGEKGTIKCQDHNLPFYTLQCLKELLIQNTPKPESAITNNTNDNNEKGGGGPAAQAHTLLLGPTTNGLPVQVPSEDRGEVCTKWMVLMAKKSFEEHEITLQTLADLFRLSLTMSGTVHQQNENNNEPTKTAMMKILIVKKERAEEDEQCLRQHMEMIRGEWGDEWGGMAEKLKRFGESDARREQLERTRRWMEDCGEQKNHLACAIAYFDDPNLMTTINKFFQFGDTGFEILDSAEEEVDKRQQLFTKPPALHWTNYPREAEVQVTFKFTFPKGTVPEWLFREWTQMGKRLMVWDYEYEWTNGILLRADELIKITITRASGEPNVVELSGRIDTDEAAEEEAEENEEAEGEEEDNQLQEGQKVNGLQQPGTDHGTSTAAEMCPLQRVWPYLVRIFQQILTDVESRKTLPFYLNLVFIGELFFNCADGAHKLSARSLDAIQTLSSIQRIKCVRFRADQDQIYSLNLDQCFPNFRPTKLADFSPLQFPLPTLKKLSVGNASSGSSSSPSEIPTAATSLGGSAIIIQPPGSSIQLPKGGGEEKMRVNRSPSCVPAFGGGLEDSKEGGGSPKLGRGSRDGGGEEQHPAISCSSLSSSPQPGQSSLHVERHLGGYKNRGRRVSFGVIHSIPSQGDASGHSTPGPASPSPLLMSISSRMNGGGSISPEPNEEGGNDAVCCKDNGHADINNHNKIGNNENGQEDEKKMPSQPSNTLVENIVEEMLQKAIDEVMVTD